MSLEADPSVPRINSEIISVWRRSANAEGNPFHVCFSRVPIVPPVSDVPPSVPTPPVDDAIPRPPAETCPEGSLVRLPTGRIAVPLLPDGLDGSADWHRDRQVLERLTLSNPTDRSILIQTKEHLAELTARFPALAESFNRPTSFGENLLISGQLIAKTVCIGDMLHVIRSGINGAPDEIVGILQPGQPMANVTVRGTCAASGLAGFFCRVLKAGSIAAGDRLVLAQRPVPKWTLAGISELMYGGKNARQAELRVWNGTEEQLQELMELKLLGWFEWRHALHKFVEKREKLALEVAAETKAEEEAKAKASTDAERARKVAEANALARKRLQMQVAIAVVAVAVGAFLFLRKGNL